MTITPATIDIPAVPSPPCEAGGQPDADELVYLRIRVPSEMRDAVERHHRHLLQLAANLQGAGIPQAVVEAHIDQAVASYRQALTCAVAGMRG